jgi:hypothetical protein
MLSISCNQLKDHTGRRWYEISLGRFYFAIGLLRGDNRMAWGYRGPTRR